MNARVKAVKANSDYTITILFHNGEIRIFDARPYLDKGFFRELRDQDYFLMVKPFLGSIQWPHGQDFCPDTLYEQGRPAATNLLEQGEWQYADSDPTLEAVEIAKR
jgi:hypothetical protein